ncbi:hypothetical protein PGTUg99_006289 [Puccinia graminis f. sp. tritici]|uniref:Uncharacterized protein n=1 Tax=Puccinia graminis f. sp. tritici TaxID=56615 RepID=A0A5B0S4P8_PUCGR|nr:hypothetical protein PGTUg99_006289 [Puccinia graminis f. sp. tritici]
MHMPGNGCTALSRIGSGLEVRGKYPSTSGMSTSYPSDIDYRLVQVTHKTRVPKCAAFSLSLLQQETDRRPLCLHTLPPPGTPVEDIEKTITTSKTNPDKNAVGRLISVAEIIKRNFTGDGVSRPSKRQKTDPNDSAQVSSNELHQYNQYGSLENLILERSKSAELSDSQKKASLMARQDKIMQEFLNEERKRPRQSHTPWLKIYLSRTEIQSLANLPNVFYQQPSMPTEAATNDTMTLSGLSALGSTLVNPQEEILEEEQDIAPV